MKKKKRTKQTLDKLTQLFEERMEWLENAWGCKTEYEVDLSTGDVRLKITMPKNRTALVVRCDVAGITVPGVDV
jgi:hypothetical protein